MVHDQNMVIPWYSEVLQIYHVHKNSTLLVCQYKIKCCWSQVSQDLPFLHPSETSVLNRLCKMGTDYVRFTEFIEQHTGHVHQQVIRAYSSCIHFVFDLIRSWLRCDFFMFHRSITPASQVSLGFMAFICVRSALGWTLCCNPIDRLYWTLKKRLYIWSLHLKSLWCFYGCL